MRLSSTCLLTFLLLSALPTQWLEAQTSLKDSLVYDSASMVAIRQYHMATAPEVGLYRGPQYVDYDYTLQKGEPFYGPDSIRSGSVWYSGVMYERIPMLYDVVKDQLVIKDPFNIYKISLLMDLVDSFYLDGQPFIPIRDSLAPAVLHGGFFDRIYEGRRFVLLKRDRKFVRENLMVTPDNVRLFVDENIDYYFKSGGQYRLVNTKAQLFDVLKDRKSEVKRLIRKSKLKWRANKEQILLAVVSYYDSVDH
jgi:hypothetical protein